MCQPASGALCYTKLYSYYGVFNVIDVVAIFVLQYLTLACRMKNTQCAHC